MTKEAEPNGKATSFEQTLSKTADKPTIKAQIPKMPTNTGRKTSFFVPQIAPWSYLYG